MIQAIRSGQFLGWLGAWFQKNWKRLLIWLATAALCAGFSAMTLHMSRFNLPWRTTKEFYCSGRYDPRSKAPDTVTLLPGQSLEQSFTAMGSLVGECQTIYLKVPKGQTRLPELTVTLTAQDTGEVLAQVEASAVQLEGLATEDQTKKEQLAAFPLSEPVLLRSGRDYVLCMQNSGREETALNMDRAVYSGSLRLGQTALDGAVDFGVLRTAGYTPSAFVPLLTAVTCATALLGLWLALFSKVKEHLLYLLLAAGFGLVMLFDVTPLYGFDMRFQFDSAYVVSNELLGLEGAVYQPSRANPENKPAHYYRRICDDYSQFQFYRENWVSDNYTDMQAALRDLRPEKEDTELILVEANQGFIGDQRQILYLPAGVGFAIARLLGLGFLPMVQMGRLVSYGVFVLLMFFAIRSVPFGKRLFLILALLPSVMVQTMSVTRDAVIIGLSFFVVAKVLALAYGEKMPKFLDWAMVWLAGALLAPCKGVYLPISLFWLAALYRRLVVQERAKWTKVTVYLAAGLLPMLVVMYYFGSSYVTTVIRELQEFLGSLFQGGAQAFVLPVQAAAEAEVLAQPQVYTFLDLLENLPFTLMVVLNTLREYLGMYFVNTLQLTDIDLGSSDTVGLILMGLLLIACLSQEEGRERLGKPERWFALAVAAAVFALTAVAALTWTEVGSYSIFGLQGRYLIPTLPLLALFAMNNSVLRLKGSHATLVKAGCCLFPALYLMNIYLWTISR